MKFTFVYKKIKLKTNKQRQHFKQDCELQDLLCLIIDARQNPTTLFPFQDI